MNSSTIVRTRFATMCSPKVYGRIQVTRNSRLRQKSGTADRTSAMSPTTPERDDAGAG